MSKSKNNSGLQTGTYVTRSTYQKVCEENKRLKADIYALVMANFEDEVSEVLGIEVMDRWRDKFEKDKEFEKLMKDFAVQYFKDNPEKRFPYMIDNPPK